MKNEKHNKFPPQLGNNIVLRWIYNRVYYEDQDCIVAVVGETGTGKTNFAVSASELLSIKPQGLYPRFKPINPRRVDLINADISQIKINPQNFNDILPDLCYGSKQLQDFWHRMNVLAEKDITSTYGRPCTIEEAQNIVNSRTYYGRTNMSMLRNFLTGRVFQNIYFLTYPSFNDIDKQIRKLIHLRIDMLKPDRENNRFRYLAKRIIDIEKNEYGNYFNVKSDNDFYFIPEKKSGVFSIPPASQRTYELTKLKSRFWKMALRAGKIDHTTGDYMEKEEVEKTPEIKKQEAKADLLKWANDNYFRKEDVYNIKANKYVVSRLTPILYLDNMPHSNLNADLVIAEWKRLDRLSKEI